MIALDVENKGSVVIAEDELQARYAAGDSLKAARPARAATGTGRSVRALVEIQHRYGGLAPRALVGGEFVTGTANEISFEVLVAAETEYGVGDECPSKIWKKPFVAGLHQEFAPAVLRALLDKSGSFQFPAGLLRVDRAGYDEVESSSLVFEHAGKMLRCVLATLLDGGDVQAEARDLMQTW